MRRPTINTPEIKPENFKPRAGTLKEILKKLDPNEKTFTSRLLENIFTETKERLDQILSPQNPDETPTILYELDENNQPTTQYLKVKQLPNYNLQLTTSGTIFVTPQSPIVHFIPSELTPTLTPTNQDLTPKNPIHDIPTRSWNPHNPSESYITEQNQPTPTKLPPVEPIAQSELQNPLEQSENTNFHELDEPFNYNNFPPSPPIPLVTLKFNPQTETPLHAYLTKEIYDENGITITIVTPVTVQVEF